MLMLPGLDMQQADPSVKDSYHIFKNKIRKRGRLKGLINFDLWTSMIGKKYLFYKLSIRKQ